MEQQELLKSAAVYIEGLIQELEENESIVKKASLIENITDILTDRKAIITLDQYREKVAELREKTAEELVNLKTLLEFHGDSDSFGFGKLFTKESSNTDQVSAEEKFNSIILGGN